MSARTHDMGGAPAGPIDRSEPPVTLTEQRVDAMMALLREPPLGLFSTDAMRRAIEDLAPDVYLGSAYYERWCYAMRDLLVETGVLTDAEIADRLAAVQQRFETEGAPP